MIAPSLRCGVALQEVSSVFGVALVLVRPAAVSCAIVLEKRSSLKRHQTTFRPLGARVAHCRRSIAKFCYGSNSDLKPERCFLPQIRERSYKAEIPFSG
jgi:hypothetical protein